MKLEQAIFADLTPEAPYGVRWWAPHPGTSRRILISDQLWACAHSVSANLIEAGIHWLEYLDSSERENDRFADALSFVNGQPIVKAPRPENVLQHLGRQCARLHQAGVVRALASALDCLSGTIVAVVALPTSILKADLGHVRKSLAAISAPGTDGERIQAQFANQFETLIANSGPAGWLEWTLQFRHMLVHRGRRIEVGQFVPRTPVLLGPSGNPVPRVQVITHLPRDPGRSDVEVFLDVGGPTAPVLTEDVEQTLRGVLQSTRALVDASARALLDVWQWRRQHPAALPQPPRQWAAGRAANIGAFTGYAPGTHGYSPTMMMTHPVIGHRLRAAALDDNARGQWPHFD